MAGLMDNPLIQTLFGGSSYLSERRANARQDELAGRYSGLLQDMMDPAQSGPTVNSGLLSQDPGRASMILGQVPGYEQLAGQGITGMQQMARQKQAQQYEEQHMSMAQRANLDLSRTQQDWQRQWQQFTHNNPSASQNQSAGIQLAGLQQAGDQFQQTQARLDNQDQMKLSRQQLHQQFPALALTGNDQIAYQKQAAGYQGAHAALNDMIDTIERAPVGNSLVNQGKLRALGEEAFITIVPVLQEAVASGTLNEGEAERFMTTIGDPASLTANKEWMTAKFKMLREYTHRKARTHLGLSGREYQPPGLGESATIKSQSKPGLRREDYAPYTPK